MVAITTINPQKISRLTTQAIEIGAETIALRCLDWDRDRFDIEFGLNNGTTYNSFLIRGEKTALVDTSHRKFEKLYLEKMNIPAASGRGITSLGSHALRLDLAQ